MTREMLWSVLKLEPFRAITLHTASGASYLVERRESIWASSQRDTVTLATDGDGIVILSMDHVMSIHVGPVLGEP